MYRPTTRGLPMQIYLFALHCVLYFFFITGTADKENWEGFRGQRFYIYICSSIFSYLWGLFYCAQDIDA